MKAVKRAPPVVLAPDIVAIRDKLVRMIRIVLAWPGMGTESWDANELLEKPENENLFGPENWDNIRELDKRVTETFRAFAMPFPASDAHIDRAIEILVEFARTTMVYIYGYGKFSASIASGLLEAAINSKPERRLQMPAIYSRLRMEVLGQPTRMAIQRPSAPA